MNATNHHKCFDVWSASIAGSVIKQLLNIAFGFISPPSTDSQCESRHKNSYHSIHLLIQLLSAQIKWVIVIMYRFESHAIKWWRNTQQRNCPIQYIYSSATDDNHEFIISNLIIKDVLFLFIFCHWRSSLCNKFDARWYIFPYEMSDEGYSFWMHQSIEH